jgi:hypothetical protein
MLVRSLLSSIAFVAVSLALSSQVSHAADCSASIAGFSSVGHGLSGKEAIYLVTLDVDPDVTGRSSSSTATLHRIQSSTMS